CALLSVVEPARGGDQPLVPPAAVGSGVEENHLHADSSPRRKRCRLAIKVKPTLAHGVQENLRPIVRAALPVDVLQVVAYCVGTDPEPAANFRSTHADDGKNDDLKLTP